MSHPGRDDLTEAWQQGDRSDFERLYRAHADGVFHLAQRVLKNPDDATDALQETFLVAFRRRETFRAEGSLRGWLYRIAVRVALRMRERSRRPLSLEAVGPVAGPSGANRADPDFREAVERAVEALPVRSRLVFTLHTVEGLSHEEIARVLDITEGTSKSQLSYARGLLRRQLRGWSP